jgi:hypothetical protein
MPVNINVNNGSQNLQLAQNTHAAAKTMGRTVGGESVESQTAKPSKGMFASFVTFFKGLQGQSVKSTPPEPARTTTSAVNEHAKTTGQAKTACMFLMRSVSTPSATGLPVVNNAMAKGALAELSRLPPETQASTLASLVKSLSHTELANLAGGMSELTASLAGPAKEGGEMFKQYIQSEELGYIVGQEQRSRALTPQNFGTLAKMIANGHETSLSELASLPTAHPAKSLFTAYLGKELSSENFNFFKAVFAMAAQTDTAVKNDMIKDIFKNIRIDDLNLSTINKADLKTALELRAAASRSNDYSSCVPQLMNAAKEIERLSNNDTVARFKKELQNDLKQLTPKAFQSDLVALSGSSFEDATLSAKINAAATSNIAADPHVGFFGAEVHGLTGNSKLDALLADRPEEPGSSSMSLDTSARLTGKALG